ncbi:MAG: exodeoxyribonuclease VII large subunit [Clostridia bacterium]|nr:exodeoxyribonuclease VII large subunit [Clostridia bacterium]
MLGSVVSVAELTGYIKDKLESDGFLKQICVKGEISNFIFHRSGHMYFTLKDETSQIKTVMFRGANMRLDFKPENGQKVLVTGNISVYEGSGNYQLYALTMRRDGVGDLFLQYAALKRKLLAEGLFDEAHKKPLPALPSKVGVITSANGAAVRDMINVATRRCPSVQLVLYPAQVQGAGTEESIIKAIDCFEERYPVDVIILGRGGGSIEDLWGFNGERLARRIFRAKTPIVSAVGHETDFTIADFVADKRAPTPSAAAELTVPDLRSLRQGLDYKTDKLISAEEALLKGGRDELNGFLKRLSRANVESLFRLKGERLKGVSGRLTSLNPLSVLSRGYSVALKENKAVKTVKEVAVGEEIEVRLADGKIQTKITQIEEIKNERKDV